MHQVALVTVALPKHFTGRVPFALHFFYGCDTESPGTRKISQNIFSGWRVFCLFSAFFGSISAGRAAPQGQPVVQSRGGGRPEKKEQACSLYYPKARRAAPYFTMPKGADERKQGGEVDFDCVSAAKK